jgi:hypothetical protein
LTEVALEFYLRECSCFTPLFFIQSDEAARLGPCVGFFDVSAGETNRPAMTPDSETKLEHACQTSSSALLPFCQRSLAARCNRSNACVTSSIEPAVLKNLQAGLLHPSMCKYLLSTNAEWKRLEKESQTSKVKRLRWTQLLQELNCHPVYPARRNKDSPRETRILRMLEKDQLEAIAGLHD